MQLLTISLRKNQHCLFRGFERLRTAVGQQTCQTRPTNSPNFPADAATELLYTSCHALPVKSTEAGDEAGFSSSSSLMTSLISVRSLASRSVPFCDPASLPMRRLRTDTRVVSVGLRSRSGTGCAAVEQMTVLERPLDLTAR